MRVKPTDEQAFLREAVAGVLAREATPAIVRAWAESGDFTTADAIPGRQGWSGIGLADELGGQGGGVIELAILAEELGRAFAPWDRLLATSLALRLLGASAAAEATGLAFRIAAGEAAAIVLLDGRAIPTPWPERSSAHSAVTLSARYVPGAGAAADLIVPVRVGERLSLLRVDPAADSVQVTPERIVDHTRALASVELTRAEATEIGTVELDALAKVGATAAVLLAADSLGLATKMLELTTAYIADRRQFGVPVGSFQAVKHAAAEMLVDVEASRSAVSYSSWAIDDDTDDALIWASIAKSHVGPAASRVADKALFLHGAIGYTWEHDLQFPFKRAKSNQLLFGAADVHRDRIAELLLFAADQTLEPALVG